MKILFFSASVLALGLLFLSAAPTPASAARPAVSSPTSVRWDGGEQRPGRQGVIP